MHNLICSGGVVHHVAEHRAVPGGEFVVLADVPAAAVELRDGLRVERSAARRLPFGQQGFVRRADRARRLGGVHHSVFRGDGGPRVRRHRPLRERRHRADASGADDGGRVRRLPPDDPTRRQPARRLAARRPPSLPLHSRLLSLRHLQHHASGAQPELPLHRHNCFAGTNNFYFGKQNSRVFDFGIQDCF